MPRTSPARAAPRCPNGRSSGSGCAMRARRDGTPDSETHAARDARPRRAPSAPPPARPARGADDIPRPQRSRGREDLVTAPDGLAVACRRPRPGGRRACRPAPRSAGRRSPGPRSRSRRPPGQPYPRLLARPAGRAPGPRRARPSTASGSASRSSSRRQRATAGGEVADVGQPQRRRDVPGRRGSATHRRAVRQAQRARCTSVAGHSSTPGTARAPRNSSSASACSGARYGSRSAIAPVTRSAGRAAGAAAQLGRRRRVDLTDRVVELADAAEAGGERDVGQPQVGRLDQHAGRSARAGPGPAPAARRRPRR